MLVLNLLGDQALFDAVWRALLAGIIVNVVVWRCAIVVWRHIIVSELRQVEEERAERRREETRAAGGAGRRAEQLPHGMTDHIRPISRRESVDRVREPAAGQAADP